jgi:uncharacterized protein
VTSENRVANAQAEAGVGDDALRAAQALMGLGLANDAVSRAYYAAFHYARALLLTKGLEPKTHRGVLALLAKHFDSPGGLSSASISSIARLETFRGLADYAAERLSLERAHEEVAAAAAFVTEASMLLRRLLDTLQADSS